MPVPCAAAAARATRLANGQLCVAGTSAPGPARRAPAGAGERCGRKRYWRRKCTAAVESTRTLAKRRHASTADDCATRFPKRRVPRDSADGNGSGAGGVLVESARGRGASPNQFKALSARRAAYSAMRPPPPSGDTWWSRAGRAAQAGAAARAATKLSIACTPSGKTADGAGGIATLGGEAARAMLPGGEGAENPRQAARRLPPSRPVPAVTEQHHAVAPRRFRWSARQSPRRTEIF